MTVHEPSAFITLGLAVSEKQIPQIVENIGNQNKAENDWRGLRFFASRGSPVRSRSRPPIFSIICGDLGRAPASTAGVPPFGGLAPTSQAGVLAKGCCKTSILQIRSIGRQFPGKRWLDGCVELPALNRNSPRLDRLRWPMGLLGLVEQYCPPSTHRRGPEM